MKSSFLLVLAAVFIIGCQNNPKSTEMSWAQKMQELKTSVSELIPYIYSREAFSNPKNEEKILDNMRSLSANTHNISEEKVQEMLGKDPMAVNYATQLKNDVDRAYEVFQDGHVEFSRTLLRGSVGYCFKCHSRSSFGPEFKFVQKSFEDPKLSNLVKADLYAATREYEESLKLLKKEMFRDKDLKIHIFSFEKAVEKYLSIMVRVKKEPLKAYKTLSGLEQKKEIPHYMQENIRTWKFSLYNWSKEKKRSSYSLAFAKSYFKKAKRKQIKGSFKSANIEFLRLTSILHDQLLYEKKPANRAQIYQMLGNSYDVIADFGFWQAPEVYYEACVKEWPHSALAKKCFKSFEEVIHLGYTGSGGMFLPKVERQRIDTLRDLAFKK